jgi:hypothetical protein
MLIKTNNYEKSHEIVLMVESRERNDGLRE